MLFRSVLEQLASSFTDLLPSHKPVLATLDLARLEILGEVEGQRSAATPRVSQRKRTS